MDQNVAAVSALHEYVKIAKPGYAFMIEAPWGAGKTHLVKREFASWLSSDKARYVTLNGVSDRRSFRRALLASISDAKLMDAAGRLGDTFGNFLKIGNVGSIVQDAIEDRMIESLPDILIFDDVERCEMSTGEILGLINNFVEHKSKKVVLCAFVERDEGKLSDNKRDEFLLRKEKVVGRTVKIIADAHNALPDFIAAMPNGKGKKWFQSNDELALEVFYEAQHNNLRVLRQCLHDCGRVIDVLEEDIYASADAMQRFVRTYLALAMAVATGELNSTQLAYRRSHEWLSKTNEGEKPHPLAKCSNRHPQAEIFAGNAASIISTKLAVSLIGIGYEKPANINEELRSTGQFSGEQQVPLWRRFVGWTNVPREELEDIYKEALSYVFEQAEIEPGPYLHIASTLIWIARETSDAGDKFAKKIESRIATLAKDGKIPPATFGKLYGWNLEGGMYSFGGYSFELDNDTKKLIEPMMRAQFDAFIKLRSGEAKRLVSLLRTDLDAFGREFSWDAGTVAYQETAILDEISVTEFSQVVFDHILSGKFAAIGAVVKTLGERHRATPHPEEIVWAKQVRKELEEMAGATGPLEKVRMVKFLGFHWRFPTDDGGDT